MADTLKTDIASAGFINGVEQGFWELVERAGDVLHFRLTAADQRTYFLRLECQGYPAEPMGGQFVNEATRMSVETAWPRGTGQFTQWVKFSGELFICWDQDRYGIQHHSDWSHKRAWTTAPPNPLVSYLRFMARLLNNPSMGYERRSTIPS